MTPAEHAVLSARLEGAGSPASPVKLDGDEFDQLLQWSSNERLFGLLVAALEDGAVVVGSDDDDHSDALERAGDSHRSALRNTLAAEATAIQAVRVLRSAGIEAFVFKGSATAHLDYPDPAMRSFYDADLHVSRADFGAAIDALVAAGYRKSLTPMGARWERRFARACEMRSSDGVELDLHAAVATGYFGTVLDHEWLRRSSCSVDLGGELVSAFSLPARTLISAYGVVLSRGPGLRLERDLAQQLAALGDRWPELIESAGYDGAAVIATALDVVSASFGDEVRHVDLAAGLRACTPSPHATRALRYAEKATRAGWSADARSSMMALGATDRFRFSAAVLASKSRRF